MKRFIVKRLGQSEQKIEESKDSFQESTTVFQGQYHKAHSDRNEIMDAVSALEDRKREHTQQEVVERIAEQESVEMTQRLVHLKESRVNAADLIQRKWRLFRKRSKKSTSGKGKKAKGKKKTGKGKKK